MRKTDSAINKMANFQLVKSETGRNQSYGLNSRADFTPYSFLKDGKTHFICNLITGANDPYEKDSYKRDEMANRLKELRKNDFKFLRFYGREKTPLDFLKWVKAKGYTIQIHGELFERSKGGNFTDFHGNLVEYSASFHFRIYDKELLKEVGKIAKSIPQKYHYKRTKS